MAAGRDKESGGVGGAWGGQAEAVGGVVGVSRAGERGKAEESEGERQVESRRLAVARGRALAGMEELSGARPAAYHVAHSTS